MTLKTSYSPGEPIWVDLSTPDVQKSIEFYGALFGWTFASASIAEQPGESYTTIRRGGRPIGGLLELTPRMIGLEP